MNTNHGHAYGHDLAYIHGRGFGAFARGSAPGLLKLFHHNTGSPTASSRTSDVAAESGQENSRILVIPCSVWTFLPP